MSGRKAFSKSPNPKFEQGDMNGLLQKMGVVNKAYRERFFLLQDGVLYYYKTAKSSSAISGIAVGNSLIRLSPDFYPQTPCFELVTPSRIYRLVAPSFDEMQQWIDALHPWSDIAKHNRMIATAEHMVLTNQVDGFVEDKVYYDKGELDEMTKHLLRMSSPMTLSASVASDRIVFIAPDDANGGDNGSSGAKNRGTIRSVASTPDTSDFSISPKGGSRSMEFDRVSSSASTSTSSASQHVMIGSMESLRSSVSSPSIGSPHGILHRRQGSGRSTRDFGKMDDDNDDNEGDYDEDDEPESDLSQSFGVAFSDIGSSPIGDVTREPKDNMEQEYVFVSNEVAQNNDSNRSSTIATAAVADEPKFGTARSSKKTRKTLFKFPFRKDDSSKTSN